MPKVQLRSRSREALEPVSQEPVRTRRGQETVRKVF